MELHVDPDPPAVIPHFGALGTNFTAQNRAPSFPNSILLDESSGTLHFVPSAEADAAASASVGGVEGGPTTASSSYITLEVHYTLLLIIMVSSVAVNGLVFVLFYQRPSVRMTSNKFVLNMAIVHLLQTFIVLPFVFVSIMFQEWIFGDVWCKIHGTVTVCLTMANVFSILLIAVDRNCAVNSPLHYSMTITKKRTSGLIVSTWVFAVLISVPPLVGVSDIEYQESWAMCTVTWYDTSLLTISYSCVLCVVGFLLPFVRITWIYASMFRAARRNSARARLHNINTSSNEMSPPPSAGLEAGSNPPLYVHRRAAWSKRTSSLSQASSLFGDEWKAVRTGVLVVVSFTACFLPFFSMTLVEPHARTRKTALRNLPAISMLFLFCSSLINPYLYVIRNKVMRKHVRKMFTCLKRKPSFFSPRGYHYSHQSPPQERKCSEEIRVPGSTASLRSGGSVDYQRPLVTHSLYQNKSGDWRIVSVTTDPRRPPSRRSSLISQQPLCVEDMAQQQQQQLQQEQSYYQHKCGPGLRGAAIRNGFYRRASLDSSKILCARYPSTLERDPESASVKLSSGSGGDRSMSFRIRGRFANREESTETCDTSCNSSYSQEEWGRHFIDSSQHRRASNARRESQSSVSAIVENVEVYPTPPGSASIAQVHHAASTAAGYPCRPVLKRGRSFAFDEHEMSVAFPPQRISQSGGLRKSRFAVARNSPKHGSSDTTTTTLESLTSTESQDLPIIASPRAMSPTLGTPYHYPPAPFTHPHHHSTPQGYGSVPLPCGIALQQHQQHTQLPTECQDRRDSGFEDTMLGRCDICETIVSESGSIKAVKFIEHA
ncbi:uncharacterized protein LOC119390025 [Rhipicephalus sanguineus]|uniref:G-protein coupled receptors family 1 profile domain-containing protein n=1 Tax=Rhipicephalus sanguineus TaxID=34632 RepID=A0A9D4SY53_RHISA|nr:uncharacterized protein LOC119390025 [Rhipicephalus sanguineus]KAH7956540.1 hypothetical protein HPB52_010360 [Rhipicephalus sanguineus]